MQDWKQTVMIGVMTLFLWGALYPQFSLVEETYVCMENKEQNPKEDFLAILEAQPGDIQVKSRFLELWKEAWNK